MNYVRLAFAFLAATLAYFGSGFILLAALPGMKAEYLKFPGVYRSNDSMMKTMPYTMIGIVISIVVASVMYAKMYPAGGGIVAGLTFGVLLGIFAVCTYAIHNYGLLNVSFALTLYEGITYFIQWVIVGAILGLIYKPF